MLMIGVGRTTLYRLIASREIRTIKLGRVTLITVSSLRELISERHGLRRPAIELGAITLCDALEARGYGNGGWR